MNWFILGSCFGSFLCACAYRYDRNDMKNYRYSICPTCHKKIAGYDLIPIISWLWLKGKCRYCHSDIPLDHLVCELITGILFAWIGNTQFKTESIILMFISCVLIYAAWTDYYHGLIPDRCHIFLMLVLLL